MTAKVRSYDETLVPVRVGQWVGFKSDIEQYGEIVKITQNGFGHYMLHLRNPDGFEGHYLRFATTTVVPADNCWID